MAQGFKPSVANLILEALLRDGTAYDGPTSVFIKLHTGAPGAAGTSNAATNTTRKSITFGAASGGICLSSNAQQWTSVPADEDYTHYTLWDDVSAGNFLGSGTLTANPVTTGDTYDQAVGAISFSLNVAS